MRKDELDSVLQDFGFTPDFTAGSHVTYRHPSGARVTVAAHGPHVRAYIVKQALKAIDEEEGGYGVEVVELPGCVTYAEEWEDIPAMVREAMTAWIGSALKHNEPVPEPSTVII